MITLHEVAAIRAAESAHEQELNSGLLMQRAAHGVSVAVMNLLTEVLGKVTGTRVVILVGPGNNGGDAMFAGAKLLRRGVRVIAVTAAEEFHTAGAEALKLAGGLILPWGQEALDELRSADLVIDGLLGIGARSELTGCILEIVRATRNLHSMMVCVDVPTGVDADTGIVASEAILADRTVTFGGCKPGLVVTPGKEFAGEVQVVDIGISDSLTIFGGCLDAADVAYWVQEPILSDHKYRRGVLGLIAGSAQYPGAAFLATSSAVAADIGMVEYFDRGDDLAKPVIAAHPPVVATVADPATNERVNAWVAGPGFTGSDEDYGAVAAVLRCSTPVVLDAGALTIVASSPELQRVILDREFPTVLTPHEGEFSRLCDVPLSGGRIAAAKSLAKQLRAVVVLKGAGTIIAGPDGSLYVDLLGTPALATAGSGDVLAGFMGSLLSAAAAQSQGEINQAGATEVVAAAVWLHSQAGRIAAHGGYPVSAAQIAAALPAAVAAVRRPTRMSL
ncbi:MAG: NAD(P)H-hydrate dehydratase [Actinobacteria bacterium]|uniref:Nicotinamide nucleotide repair protein n=1 Tax=freshwater metagenome TaxID=449393 RepID=A0A6J7S7H5_9ZZZZ|nr:NAD(P)H-hydrate dehydratase [Actinomycetota bacterium]